MASNYCFYGRVSTKRQGESGLGLEAQREIVRHFYPDISVEFIEVKSGKNAQDRPILRDAIDHCIKNDCVLVVAKVDRLTRSAEDGLAILREMEGRIRFCDLPGEPDKFMLTLFFAFAERERELISIRTKAALKAAKDRGKRLGVCNPSGKRKPWSPDVSRIGAIKRHDDSEKNENNVRAFAIAKEMASSGQPYRVIVATLNRSNFKTPSGHGSWSLGSVHRLLKKG